MDAAGAAARLRRDLAKHGTASRAAGAKAYMRSDLDFLGVTVPQIRRTAAAWLKANPDLDTKGLRAVVDRLWRPPVFEGRLLCTVLLQHRSALLRPADIPWLQRLVRASRAWAILDNLVPYAVADVLARDPARRRRVLAKWASEDDFWMRRSAILCMHRDLARGAGDWPLWVMIADGQLEDQARWAATPPSAQERFFIRKALGWALRDRAAARPDEVVAFLQARRGRVAGLTWREATRKLPAALRARLAA